MDLVKSCSTPEGAVQAILWCVTQGEEQMHVLKALLHTHIRFRSKLSDFPDLCTDILFKVSEHRSETLLEVVLPYVSDNFLSKDWCGKTFVTRLLCVAVENGNSKMVRLLSRRGAKGTAQSSYRGKPMFHLAVLAGNLDVAEELLSAGADIMAADIRNTPLLISVIIDPSDKQREEKVTWLLKHGADPKMKATSGKEPIHVAAAHSGPIIVQLIQAGCDVNTQDPIHGDTPLHIACARCCEDAIVTLIQHGAKLNQQNNQGETPLEKLLKYVQTHSYFHSQTRINLAKSLVKLGFRIPLKNNNNCASKSNRVGRDKVADWYKTVVATVTSPGSLQNMCRLTVREEVRGQCFEKSVSNLEVPRLVKEYLMFKDNAGINIESLVEE